MGREEALDSLSQAVLRGGLVDAPSSGVVMVSGGPDSACLAAGLARAIGPERVHALHVNYGLRDSADRDERVCRDLCSRLRIDLHIDRPEHLHGNLQAAAREFRYAAAERLRVRTGGDWIATGHTRTDLAETFLYRLAVSPGARSLRCLPAQSGRIVRPLLELERAELRQLAIAATLPFADDETNLDPAFARNRIRAEVLPVFRELSAAPERNIAETQAEMIEEARLLERIVLEALEAAGAGAGSVAIRAEALEGSEPALRRLALRALAERASGRAIPLSRRRAGQIVRLARMPEGGQVDLGHGVTAICEGGLIRFETASEADAAPAPAPLRVPGTCRFGQWEVRAELRAGPLEPAGPDLATLDAVALGDELVVRTWQEGDRMRPLGMSGTKTLQDLFTDRGVPRSLRHHLPVVTAAGRVVWVAGVAVSEDFRLSQDAEEVAVLTARVLD
ncbi:MAG TPA: tRNA lysidine(34) synthetase TilS [Solirubrobacterales bacterium]|jgi:tRNA(Ile)-lysidine synthase|nr:tRNA lysidine(34) synthetase TilS [Solirubrobacterales bacterium]